MDIISHCFDWIPILLGEKCLELFTEREPIPELPLDIMINILSRLPAKCVVKLWKFKPNHLYALTKTPCFIRTHLNRATQTVVVHSLTQSSDNEIKLFFINEGDQNVEAASFNLGLRRSLCKPTIVLCGSYDGFLLFKTKDSQQIPDFRIWNPITKEKVIVNSPCQSFYVCGFYFHPRKKEYEVVCAYISGGQSQFQVLNLRNKQRRSVGSSSYLPDHEKPPVFVNGTLYWMVDLFLYYGCNNVYPSLSNSILAFNTKTEEFSMMETVKPVNDTSICYRVQLQLFEMQGDLCLFDSSSYTELVIWVFNFITKFWVKMHTMAVPDDDYRWRFYWYSKEVVCIKKKSLFLFREHQDKRLMHWNLRLGTCKFVEKKGFEGDDFAATIHTHSLVSLHAADTVISLKF